MYMWLLFAIGLISGMCSYIFGIGGGIIIIPALVLFAKMSMQRAVPLSLISMIPITIISATTHYWQVGSQVSAFVVVLLTSGALLGSFIGSHSVHTISHKLATRILCAFLILIAFVLAEVFSFAPVAQLSFLLLLAIGFGIGFICGFFGMSGGFLLVPLLVMLFSFPYSVAIATSLLSLTPILIASTLFHHVNLRFYLHSTVQIVVGAFFGVLLGFFLSHLIPAQGYTWFFSLFLVFVAIRLWFREG
ncbi:MAG: sulfite exporter TauE/SafE family protein [Candidatus Woesearchaeota archaeon]